MVAVGGRGFCWAFHPYGDYFSSLAELRDWLLPMLMNGQVKVEDINEDALPIAAEPKAEYKTR